MTMPNWSGWELQTGQEDYERKVRSRYMSECVVRMDMPCNCWACPCGQNTWVWGDDGKEKMACFCGVDDHSEVDGHYILETWTEAKRPSWCPILAVLPEKHGRLVDADEIVKRICSDCAMLIDAMCDGGRTSCYPASFVYEQETIVPATEGGNYEAD